MIININKFPVDITVCMLTFVFIFALFCQAVYPEDAAHISRTKKFFSKFKLYYKSILGPITQKPRKNNHIKARSKNA